MAKNTIASLKARLRTLERIEQRLKMKSAKKAEEKKLKSEIDKKMKSIAALKK